MRKICLHRTGGGAAAPPLTAIEEAVWRILGKTPGFVGIVDRKTDSKIVMKRSARNNDLHAKVCNATMVGQTTGLTRAMNTSKNFYLNVKN